MTIWKKNEEKCFVDSSMILYASESPQSAVKIMVQKVIAEKQWTKRTGMAICREINIPI